MIKEYLLEKVKETPVEGIQNVYDIITKHILDFACDLYATMTDEPDEEIKYLLTYCPYVELEIEEGVVEIEGQSVKFSKKETVQIEKEGGCYLAEWVASSKEKVEIAKRYIDQAVESFLANLERD